MGGEEDNRAESQVLFLPESVHAHSLPPPEDPCSPPKPTDSDKLEDDENKKVHLPVCENTALAQVEAEQRLALIKAWEESEKAKADNKSQKRFSAVGLWEETKKAAVESELKKLEEKHERKKAEFAEKLKNRVAEIHQAAEEKRVTVEAKRKEECIKVEDAAAGYRAKSYVPRKFLGCFMP